MRTPLVTLLWTTHTKWEPNKFQTFCNKTTTQGRMPLVYVRPYNWNHGRSLKQFEWITNLKRVWWKTFNTVTSGRGRTSGIWGHLTNEHRLYVESSFKALERTRMIPLQYKLLSPLTLPTALRKCKCEATLNTSKLNPPTSGNGGRANPLPYAKWNVNTPLPLPSCLAHCCCLLHCFASPFTDVAPFRIPMVDIVPHSPPLIFVRSVPTACYSATGTPYFYLHY
jgi:hypothetical protein